MRCEAVGRMTVRSHVRKAWSSAALSAPDGLIRLAAKTKPGATRLMISEVWHDPLFGQVLLVLLVVFTQAIMKARAFCAYFASPLTL